MHRVSKKFPPFNCLKLCQIWTDFQKFCTAGKHLKFATKPVQQYPPHLRYVAPLPWEIKTSNFLQIWKKIQTNCILSAPVVLPIVRWSDREHLVVLKEDKVSDRLREFLKQNLSALHASSAVRVCLLLCMAPLETFQPQVLTSNPGQRRPMNTCLPQMNFDDQFAFRPTGSTTAVIIALLPVSYTHLTLPTIYSV